MNHQSDLRAELEGAGIALRPGTDRDPTPPWYVLGLQGIGGWLAAVFLMGFLGLGFLQVLDNAIVALIVGLLLLGGAYTLLRLQRSIFLEQLILAFSLAGQLLIAFAIADWLSAMSAFFWWCLFVLQTALAVVMPNRIHRTFSSLFAALALFFAASEMGLVYLISPLVLAAATGLWLHEFRYPSHWPAIKSAAMGLVLALLVMQYLTRFPEFLSHSMETPLLPHWLGEWLIGATLFYLTVRALKSSGVTLTARSGVLVAGALMVLCLASSFAYGLTQGVVLIALGFAVSHRLMTGLGVISLLFSVSTYYYRLDLTLLEKSITLLSIGLLLVVIRALLLRCSNRDTGEDTYA